MPGHCHESGFLLDGDDTLCIGKRFRHGNLDFDMFARPHDFDSLAGMQRGRRRENRCFDAVLCETLFEINRPVRHTEFTRNCFGYICNAANQARNLDVFDVFKRGKMFLAKCTFPHHADFHYRSTLKIIVSPGLPG